MSIWNTNKNNDLPIFLPEQFKAMEAEIEYLKRFEKEKADAMAEHFEKDQQRYFGSRGASDAIRDALVYGEGILKINEESLFDINKAEYGVIYKNPGPPPCIHQPIDVGFATTKMVCKKCNKDL